VGPQGGGGGAEGRACGHARALQDGVPPVRLLLRGELDSGFRFRLPARVESSRASPPRRPREDGLAYQADTSRPDLAYVLGLLSRWRLSNGLDTAKVV
jgi:hypothetical protein